MVVTSKIFLICFCFRVTHARILCRVTHVLFRVVNRWRVSYHLRVDVHFLLLLELIRIGRRHIVMLLHLRQGSGGVVVVVVAPVVGAAGVASSGLQFLFPLFLLLLIIVIRRFRRRKVSTAFVVVVVVVVVSGAVVVGDTLEKQFDDVVEIADERRAESQQKLRLRSGCQHAARRPYLKGERERERERERDPN